MSEQKSALETWAETVESEDRGSIAGYLPLALSAAGALGVTPFAIMRWMSGDWIIASIDTTIVAGFIILGTYVYRSRNVRGSNIAISLLCVAGAVITVYLRGVQQSYWVFPALMVSFYLLRPREALALTISMIAILLPRITKTEVPFLTMTVAITATLTAAFAYAFSVLNNRQQQQLVDLATKDPLTGAGNRRALRAKLEEIIASFKRSGLPASLILIDLDHFKKVNDLHGHAVGDQILQRLTETLSERIRLTDRLYRIGGEEFVVVANEQNTESAAALAEQLRSLVEKNQLAPNGTVTISLGIAELRGGESRESWLQRADEALYRAKRAGRNTIRHAT